MPTDRIATVKATGKRYRVMHIDFSSNRPKVACWGEVASFRGLRARCRGTKTFLKEAVEIKEEEITPELLKELWEQGIQGRREEDGHVMVLSRTGRTVTDYGKAEELLARDASVRMGALGSTVDPEVLAQAFKLIK
jgi:hypothetical protein